jgi:diguanylate cyclase (GGDEF)-like protein
MIREAIKSQEPMCALDPLLLIPRIEYAKDIYDFAVSQAKEYCLVILDMKNFHLVNDLYGYDTGDIVIETFIRKLRSRLPAGSISLRFRHGDEFLFFVPEDMKSVEALFNSFREECEKAPALSIQQDEIFISYRFAVIKVSRFADGVQTMLAQAEKALREVKGQGSPRVESLFKSLAKPWNF